jgi:hypothetical protein
MDCLTHPTTRLFVGCVSRGVSDRDDWKEFVVRRCIVRYNPPANTPEPKFPLSVVLCSVVVLSFGYSIMVTTSCCAEHLC